MPGGIRVPIKEVDTAELLQTKELKINQIHEVSRAAVQCGLNTFAASFLQNVFQDTPSILQSLFFIRGSQQPVHRDYPYVSVQEHIAYLAASWVALEDVRREAAAGVLLRQPSAREVTILRLGKRKDRIR